MLYVLTPFLQVVTSVAFSKCFGAFIITIAGFTLKILKKSIKFPKKLVSSKNFFSAAMRKMLSYGLGNFFSSRGKVTYLYQS